MDIGQAKLDLGSPVIRERLAAARALARRATTEEVPFLRERLANESVQWVRDALRAAISRAELVESGSQEGEWIAVDVDPEIRARAVVEVTGQLLHEMEPLVGLLRAQLYEEWDAVRGSKSEVQLSRLDEFLDVMTNLHTAAQVPVLREVELRAFVDSVVEGMDGSGVAIQLAGPELRVTSDARLLRLIVRNGLQNAVEASPIGSEIVVAWGRSREGFFISIVDHGSGLPSGFTLDRIQMGNSSKQGHLGMGLSLIRQAAESLGATVKLTGRTDRGARLELHAPDGA